ncbi:MAG: type III pantothenate kinase [Candidatus Margulisbacteria bacterium]|nr:type III pantothenate kinase [Candidatus Margulisiibacteriota bacterium]MBU1021267.1 type III pantothenate kinase [Candidatus Margulisiibacteriota bacterium]MBU1729244.1 type III pantothenate kinase [Candidatus Margulisiibacteriota bacterium]MBU1954917.1 type III pantothenate kinase [Candidatus Margulisiibacteriota bacterium]
MLLALDIGNTSITFGVFDGKNLVRSGRAPSPSKLPVTEWAKIDKIIVASVVPSREDEIEHLAVEKLKIEPHFVQHNDIKMKIALTNKKEIGIDRLVNAYAAQKLYGAPAIVVDFGTATTFCAVSEDGTYQGGAIAPGIEISRDALHDKTAKLPKIMISDTDKAIGKDTVEAMKAGIYIGYIGLVNELIKRFKHELGPAKVVATGGYARMLSKAVNFDIIDELLTLKGLQMIAAEKG